MEINLRNESALSLTGSWCLLVVHLHPHSSSTVYSNPIPNIPAGISWTGTFALNFPSAAQLSSSTTNLAIFLCFNNSERPSGGIEERSTGLSSSLVLLHVFTLDAVHALLAGSGAGGDGGNDIISNGGMKMSLSGLGTWQELRSLNASRLGIKIAVPKALFGLEPAAQPLLDLLMKQGNGSLRAPLPSIDPFKQPFTHTSGISNLSLHRQNKAAIQGVLSAYSSGSKSSLAEVSCQPAEWSGIIAAASPNAEFEVQCTAGSLSNCLKVHEGVLRRVLTLQTAVKESSTSNNVSSYDGIILPNGVLVPAACNATAGLDANALDAAAGRIEELKAAAVLLKGEAVEGLADREGLIIKLKGLIVSTRELTGQLTMTI